MAQPEQADLFRLGSGGDPPPTMETADKAALLFKRKPPELASLWAGVPPEAPGHRRFRQPGYGIKVEQTLRPCFNSPANRGTALWTGICRILDLTERW